MIEFTRSITYTARNIQIVFTPVQLVGFSHSVRVVMDGKVVARDWLSSTHKVGVKSAEFFYNKHMNLVLDAGKPGYEKAKVIVQ